MSPRNRIHRKSSRTGSRVTQIEPGDLQRRALGRERRLVLCELRIEDRGVGAPRRLHPIPQQSRSPLLPLMHALVVLDWKLAHIADGSRAPYGAVLPMFSSPTSSKII
jgi:hypothetical protein